MKNDYDGNLDIATNCFGWVYGCVKDVNESTSMKHLKCTLSYFAYIGPIYTENKAARWQSDMVKACKVRIAELIMLGEESEL